MRGFCFGEVQQVIVIVESPYAGDTDLNHAYAIKACKDCKRRRELPFASHLIYPLIYDDLRPEEREVAITAGYEFASKTSETSMDYVAAFLTPRAILMLFAPLDMPNKELQFEYFKAIARSLKLE